MYLLCMVRPGSELKTRRQTSDGWYFVWRYGFDAGCVEFGCTVLASMLYHFVRAGGATF